MSPALVTDHRPCEENHYLIVGNTPCTKKANQIKHNTTKTFKSDNNTFKSLPLPLSLRQTLTQPQTNLTLTVGSQRTLTHLAACLLSQIALHLWEGLCVCECRRAFVSVCVRLLVGLCVCVCVCVCV